jgi:hypothetical protein
MPDERLNTLKVLNSYRLEKKRSAPGLNINATFAEGLQGTNLIQWGKRSVIS